ncbi:MATE family efflux transporter [Fusobacterium simiae]|uniref:Multidrug export protein MepA n=1 Tax=Fusobacterium simiae TaxID=855 RepID=A0ABT4DKZ1_FUSSI|nr:MATE family efflux transporter [Fusobacterium simiae]MCY7009275.1 MATE family efflux transporter [Fusobacterium simiae]
MKNERTKELMRYVFPAVGGLCVLFLYNIVDGIFVGQGVGATALGAVNMSVPFVTATMAFASMFPMGGATIIAIRTGQGDKEGANQAFMSALTLTTIVSLVLTVIGMVFAKEIIMLSGGSNLSSDMVDMSVEYLFYFMAFCFPMLMSPCLSVFVRNDGVPGLAFWGMCAGAISNIFLDWLFVFPFQWGIVGAAIASGLGQIVSCVVLLSHFIYKKGDMRIKKFHLNFSLMKTICKCGIPEVASQLTTPVTSFCYNIVLASIIGDLGISTFSVLSFLFSLANAILMGVAQGMQPLWGKSYGMQDKKSLSCYFKTSFWINVIISTTITIIFTVFAEEAILIFNDEADLVASGMKALPIFALSFIPMGINLIIAGYFFSIQRTVQANIISMSRGIVLKAIVIFLLPMLFGETVIWLSPFVAELITLGIAGIIMLQDKKNENYIAIKNSTVY